MEKLIEFFNKVVFYRFFVSIGIGFLAFYFILVPFLNLTIYQDKHKKLPQSIIDLYDLSNIGVDYNFLTVLVFLVITFIVGEIISIAGESLLFALFNIRFSYIFDKIPEKFCEPLGLKANKGNDKCDNEGNDKYDFEYMDPFSSNKKLGYNQLCQGRESFCFEMSEIFFSLSRAFMAIWLVSIIGFIGFLLLQSELENQLNKSSYINSINSSPTDGESQGQNQNQQCGNEDSQQKDLNIKIISNFVLTFFIFTLSLTILLPVSKIVVYLYALSLTIIFYLHEPFYKLICFTLEHPVLIVFIIPVVIIIVLAIVIKHLEHETQKNTKETKSFYKVIFYIIFFFPSLFPAIIILIHFLTIILLTLKYIKNGGYVDFVFTIIFAIFIQYTLFAAIHYRKQANIILQWLYENELKKQNKIIIC